MIVRNANGIRERSPHKKTGLNFMLRAIKTIAMQIENPIRNFNSKENCLADSKQYSVKILKDFILVKLLSRNHSA